MALSQQYEDLFAGCVKYAVTKLYKIAVQNDYNEDCVYYSVACPWLQVKLLRLLQYYPAPTDRETVGRLTEVFQKIFLTADATHAKSQQANATNAVLLEAINCVIHLRIDNKLIGRIIGIVGGFLDRDQNLRYLALETMTHIAAMGDPERQLAPYQDSVTTCLLDKDITVRRQALDLLYSMCNHGNVRVIVAELLGYLRGAEQDIREEMVLKIAILAEKFVEEYTWYVDIIFQLITAAGDDANDAIWHRVVYIVTNNEDLREYAAYTIMQSVRQPHCHEMTVKIAGFLLGEFGHLIVETPGCSPFEQFICLQSKFSLFSRTTKAILLSTYFKFVNLFPEIKNEIMSVLENFQYVLDMELQQRACEYYAILQLPDDELLQVVCAEMPHFPESESMLLLQLKNKTNDTGDIRVWTVGGKDAQNDLLHQRKASLKTHTHSGRADVKIPHKIKEDDDLLGLDEQSEQQIPPSPEKVSEWLNQLHLNSNGILYEDNVITIGLKSEYQGNIGRIAVFYQNKLLNSVLDHFNSNIIPTDQINFTLKQPMGDILAPSVQNTQIFNIECVKVPASQPTLRVNFAIGNHPISIDLALPVSISSFLAPVQITGPDFFGRWKQIGGAPKEVQNVFKPPRGVDVTKAKSDLKFLHFEVLEGVDPNVDNIVAAGIFSAASLGKVGCLLRLESNHQHQVHDFLYRFIELLLELQMIKYLHYFQVIYKTF
jgi:AP-2 complex subunit alpha